MADSTREPLIPSPIGPVNRVASGIATNHTTRRKAMDWKMAPRTESMVIAVRVRIDCRSLTPAKPPRRFPKPAMSTMTPSPSSRVRVSLVV